MQVFALVRWIFRFDSKRPVTALAMCFTLISTCRGMDMPKKITLRRNKKKKMSLDISYDLIYHAAAVHRKPSQPWDKLKTPFDRACHAGKRGKKRPFLSSLPFFSFLNHGIFLRLGAGRAARHALR